MGHGHTPADVHDHFRHDAAVDWARLARDQQARLPLADAWWSMLGRPAGQRLADLGCGPGVLAHRYAELGADVLAVDLRDEALRHVPRHPRLHNLRHDIEAAPLPRPVDVAVLSDVLHHVPDPGRLLANVWASTRRVLVAETAPEASQGPPGQARIAPSAMERLLRDAGFTPAAPAWPGPGQYAIVADG